jgi:hypothetical protein
MDIIHTNCITNGFHSAWDDVKFNYPTTYGKAFSLTISGNLRYLTLKWVDIILYKFTIIITLTCNYCAMSALTLQTQSDIRQMIL